MAVAAIPGGKFKVTITKQITREGARKTLERLFMQCKVASAEVNKRSSKFLDKPKRRGGRIWTKYANKLHIELPAGTTATIKATPQHARDLASVDGFVSVEKA